MVCYREIQKNICIPKRSAEYIELYGQDNGGMYMNQEYIYEYENGRRIRNLGFLKVKKQPDKCTIEIYARDMDEVKGVWLETSEGRKYLASWEEEVQVELPQPGQPVQHNEPETPYQPEEPKKEEIETEEYIKPSTTIYEKIQRKDLSRLPRKEWRIANNSFLLHGFYNYHHLLYIEEGDDVWIGVPGIYHEKEKLAANTFGFTHFRRQADVPVELEANEQNTYDDFGYWCRQIPVPKV